MPARRADADDATVGHNIRVQRLAKKMSQSVLADAIGITFQQVQKYEKGVNRVGAGRLVKIAAALDLPVMTLLDGIPGAGRKRETPAALALIAHAQPLRIDQGVRGDRRQGRAACADEPGRGDRPAGAAADFALRRAPLPLATPGLSRRPPPQPSPPLRGGRGRTEGGGE